MGSRRWQEPWKRASLYHPETPRQPCWSRCSAFPMSLLFLVLSLEQTPVGRREGRAARGPLWTNTRDLEAELLVLVT